MYADPSGHLAGLLLIGVWLYCFTPGRQRGNAGGGVHSELCGYGGSVDMG